MMHRFALLIERARQQDVGGTTFPATTRATQFPVRKYEVLMYLFVHRVEKTCLVGRSLKYIMARI